jgi:selenocysteine-specific translation elongation factor
LNLARIEAAQLQRGDTLVEPETIAAVDTIDAGGDASAQRAQSETPRRHSCSRLCFAVHGVCVPFWLSCG